MRKTKLKKKIGIPVPNEVKLSLLNKLEIKQLFKLQTEGGTIDIMNKDIKQLPFPARNQVSK